MANGPTLGIGVPNGSVWSPGAFGTPPVGGTAGVFDLSLLDSTVKNVLDLNATAAEQAAQGKAKAIEATGDTSEAGLYGSAIDIATQNALFERMAGEIQNVQEATKARATIGAGLAAAASNGYSGNSLSSLSIMQQSLRNSAIAQQLGTVQTEATAGGLLEQAAASGAEQQAANTAASTAATLSDAETKAAAISTANAANETAALEKLMSPQIEGTLTPQQTAEQGVVTSVLQSPLNGPVALPAGSVPGLPGSPTTGYSPAQIAAVDASFRPPAFSALLQGGPV